MSKDDDKKDGEGSDKVIELFPGKTAPTPSIDELAALGFEVKEDDFETRRSQALAELDEVIPLEDLPEVDMDLAAVRRNYRQLMSQGGKALKDLIALAKASDHPRAYEVVTQMINAVAQLNKDLVDLHTKKADLKIKSGKAGELLPPGATVNNLFVGSTAELHKVLRQIQDVKPIEQA